MQLPTKPDTTKTYLYNPTKSDFMTTYANEDNEPIVYTLRSEELKEFPKYIADHIAEHLAHEIVMTRGVKTNYDDDKKKVFEEIYADL